MFDFYRTTFRGEGQALAKFNHPNIVHVHQVLDALGTTYLALEHVDGIELETWLRSYNGRPSQRQVDEFLVPLLSALDAIYAARYLHRDISPRNIMLTRAGLAPKLLDFGAARSITSTSTTAVGLVSNLYSAPESHPDNPSTQGPWTDIYSVAATVSIPPSPGRLHRRHPRACSRTPTHRPAKRVERVDSRQLPARDRLGPDDATRGAAAVDPGLAEAPAALPGPAEPPGAAQPGCAQDLHLLPQSRHRAGGRPHLRPARLQVRGRQHLLRHQRDPGRRRLQGAHKRAMAESAAVVAVIGPGWLTRSARWSLFKRAAPEDHVHTEIALALAEAVPIVPVLVGGAKMPDPGQVPQAIREVTRINAAVVRGRATFTPTWTASSSF